MGWIVARLCSLVLTDTYSLVVDGMNDRNKVTILTEEANCIVIVLITKYIMIILKWSLCMYQVSFPQQLGPHWQGLAWVALVHILFLKSVL